MSHYVHLWDEDEIGIRTVDCKRSITPIKAPFLRTRVMRVHKLALRFAELHRERDWIENTIQFHGYRGYVKQCWRRLCLKINPNL